MDCDECPLKDFIDSVWSLTTKHFLRGCRVAVGLRDTMDREGKGYPLVEKRNTYWGMLMANHGRCSLFMDSLVGAEEVKSREMKLFKVPSRQATEIRDIVECCDSAVMLRNIGYDGKRYASVAWYPVTQLAGRGE